MSPHAQATCAISRRRLLQGLLSGVAVGLAAPLPQAWAAAELSPADLALIERLTWGANAQSVAEFQRLGRGAWLANQLKPGAIASLPAPVQAQVDGMTITKEPLDRIVTHMDGLWQEAMREKSQGDNQLTARRAFQAYTNGLLDETLTRQLLRATHAPDQLREQMTWFWFNHFNILGHGNNIPGLIGDYEQRALRSHALGRFRDMLGAVATHPAMLVYLNNNRNVARQINENYARELMELHTLGVDGGYTQADVQHLARILTGLGTHQRPGQGKDEPGLQRFTLDTARFTPSKHDMDDKQLLGRHIAGQGWAEIEQTLDLLAAHPSTARHLSRKIARYLVADEPPDALVQRMAKRYLDTDGDIAAVLATLIESPEFTASLGKKFKDPIHYLVSAVRLAYPEPRPIGEVRAAQRWLDRMGQRPYGRATPDGYPLTANEWNSSGQMTARFEVARVLSQGARGFFATDPARTRLDNDYYRQQLAPRLSANTRAALAEARAPADWNTTLLSSPEFMNR